MFANRHPQQVQFVQSLHAATAPLSPGPWNTAVVGPWGIGKTSLLRRFARLAASHDPPLGVAVLSATSALGSLDAFASMLLRRVEQDLRAQMSLAERVRREVSRWEPRVSLSPLSASRHDGASYVGLGADLLYSELRRLWNQALETRVAAVLICLDDVQHIVTREPAALLILRALFQDLQGAGASFPLVVTGPDDLFDSTTRSGPSEPVTRFFERMRLSEFSLEDTAAAVREPLHLSDSKLQVPDEGVAVVFERTMGHPFFVSLAMRELVNRANDAGTATLDRSFILSNWPSVAARLDADKFDDEWRSTSRQERAVLAAVAESRSLREVPNGSAFARRLVAKGLLAHPGRGVYRLYHPLFADYVVRHNHE